jgi:hypothetical protein
VEGAGRLPLRLHSLTRQRTAARAAARRLIFEPLAEHKPLDNISGQANNPARATVVSYPIDNPQGL